MNWFTVERPAAKIAAQILAFAISRGVLLLASIATARQTGVAGYGIFAVALVVYQAGVLLRDAGLGQSLIVLGGREHGVTLVTAFAISLVGIGLGLLMGLLAVPLTTILGVPEAAPVLGILALAFAIGSLGIASNATLERDLRFVARAAIDILSFGVLGIVTAIGLARGAGVDALAWGFVAQAVVQSGLGIILAPPWNDRGGSLAGLLRVARYGALLWVSAGLAYLAANVDHVLVARLAGAASLGIYALSYMIGNTITIGIAQVLNRVALPYYGRDHSDKGAIERTLRTIIPLSVALAAIPATVIIALGPEIGDLVFDPGTSILPITLLAVYGVVRAFGMGLGTALNGVGAARASVGGALVNVLLMIAVIPPALALAGPAGVAAAVLLAMSASSGYLALMVDRRIGLDLRTEVGRLSLGVCGGVVAALLVPVIPLPIRLVGGAVVVIGLSAVAYRIVGVQPVRAATPDVGST